MRKELLKKISFILILVLVVANYGFTSRIEDKTYKKELNFDYETIFYNTLIFPKAIKKTFKKKSLAVVVKKYGPNDDFDGDGILNKDDLDDDNDGILDVDEGYVDCSNSSEENVTETLNNSMVPNPSFEEKNSSAPVNGRDLMDSLCKDWYTFGSPTNTSPDYYDNNGFLAKYDQVPRTYLQTNYTIVEVPKTTLGNRFISFDVHDDRTSYYRPYVASDYNEGVQVDLKTPMEAGVTYKLTVSLGASRIKYVEDLQYRTGGPFNGDFIIYGLNTPNQRHFNTTTYPTGNAAKELLRENIITKPSDWVTYTFILRPTEKTYGLAFFGGNAERNHRGAILMDGVGLYEYNCDEHDNDIDKDGIPNYFDLDSDNDGCSDAFEAGATTNTTKNFSFAIQQGNNNGDKNANGLADAVENSKGNINYNLDYDAVSQDSLVTCAKGGCTDSDKTGPNCDFDDDGIINSEDIDDDNDGILDVDEGFEPCAENEETSNGSSLLTNPSFEEFTKLPNISSYGNIADAKGWQRANGTTPEFFYYGAFIGGANGLEICPKPNYGKGFAGIIGGGFNSVSMWEEMIAQKLQNPLKPQTSYTLDLELGSPHLAFTTDLLSNLGGDYDGDLVIYGYTNPNISFPYNNDSEHPVLGNEVVELYRGRVRIADYTWISFSANFKTPNKEIYGLSFAGDAHNGSAQFTNNNSYLLFDNLILKESCTGTTIDTDKDGFPDHLDTDSDDDGCFDAIEGSGDFSQDQVNVIGQLIGKVNNQGQVLDSKNKKITQAIGQSRNKKDATSCITNKPPKITNNKGKATNTINYNENENKTVVNMNATDPDGETEGNGLTWKIKGGADANDFEINEDNGELQFKKLPDFENPHDSNKDNVYNIVVEVKDTPGATAEQEQIITVKDVDECLGFEIGPECDFDKDGIPNKDDLDDDNDGVLDTQEISIYGMNATQKGGAKNTYRANKTPDGKYAVLGKGDFVTLELSEPLNNGDISTIYWRKTNGKGRIRVDFSSNGSTFTNLTGNLNISRKNAILPRNITIPKDGVTHIRIRRTGKGSIGLDAVVATGGDKDKDGFPDQFDADSDGDGCFDATESGGVDTNADGFLDGTGISDKGLVIGGNGGYDGSTIMEYEAIEVAVDTKGLKNKKVNTTTGLELFVTGEASKATSYENGVPVYETKGNANTTLAYQWYIEESGSLNKLSNNSIYEGVTTAKLSFKENLPVAVYKYVLEVTNKDQTCFEESYNVKITVECEIKDEGFEAVGISPTTCTPANDGKIEISNINLLVNTAYKVIYKKVGGNTKEKEIISDNEGKLTIEGLNSGEYTNLSVTSLNNNSCTIEYTSTVTVPEKDITYFELNSTKVDESYTKAKDGVIEVSITGLSNFSISVTNANGDEMPKVSDYNYEALAPGIYKIKVTDNDTNCSQEEEVEIRAALPPDFEIGFKQLNNTVSLFNIGENPINFILRIGEVENERSNPEPIRIIIAKIPHFKLKYDATLTKLGGVRRLKNKEWQVSENDKAYFLTYTPSNSSDEIKNEAHDIGITGSFEITPESVAGIVNLLIAIDQKSGGEENPKNNLVDIPITIKAE